MKHKPSPSLIELGFGEVPAIDMLLACAEAARCPVADIVNRRLDQFQVDTVKRTIRDMAERD